MAIFQQSVNPHLYYNCGGHFVKPEEVLIILETLSQRHRKMFGKLSEWMMKFT